MLPKFSFMLLNCLPDVHHEGGLPLQLELDVVREHPLLLVHPLHPRQDVGEELRAGQGYYRICYEYCLCDLCVIKNDYQH